MSKQRSFRDLEERLNEISADGGTLKTLPAVLDFERLRPILENSGRPALDAVLKFKTPLLQGLCGLSLATTEKMGWMRF